MFHKFKILLFVFFTLFQDVDDDDDDVLSEAMNTNLDSHPKRLSPEGEERKDPFHSPLSSTLCLPTAAGNRQLADSTDNVSSSSHSSYCTSEGKQFSLFF